MAQRRRRKKEKKQQEETLIDIASGAEQARGFFEENQRIILGVVGALALIVGGWFAYQQFYKAPLQKEALDQIYKAEQVFAQDSMTKALTDPGGAYPGFRTAIEKYGVTDAGNASNLYAAISYLQLGQYEVVIDYLNDFDAKGKIAPILKNGLKGDAYSELDQLEKALGLYKKAGNYSDNDFLCPYYLLKAGMLSEKLEKYGDALKLYQKIKKDFPESTQGQSIDKYIGRVEAKL